MHTMGWKTWRHGDPHAQNYAVCSDDLARINMIYHFYAPCYVEYSSINKMAKYDWNTFRNYVAFLAGGVAQGTRRPHHDSELISCYHDAFQTWGNYHNNIVLFYHDSPITRSHFMDPTDRAIKGFYCISRCGTESRRWVLKWRPVIRSTAHNLASTISRAANLWKLASVTICYNFKIFGNISPNFSIFTQ